VQALLQQLVPDWPGITLEVLPEVDSTNTELLRRFKADPCAALAPTLLVAEQQSAGRGRQGRTWQSARGKSLTFSLGLPLQRLDWSGLSLAVGVSVAQSLDPAAVDEAQPLAQGRIGLKWPNDLCLQQAGHIAKIGGILVETTSRQGVRYAVVGVGLNIDLPHTLHWAAGALPAGSLQTVQPGLHAADALCKIVPALLQDLQRFAQSGFAPFQDRFATRDVLAHRAVQCSDGCQGTALGVNEQGALRVQTAAGLQTITQADVSVRPSPDLG
jgi:BirA family biotin operon repressor/biotin-[acetyl-CoA-carboxylase] ligase